MSKFNPKTEQEKIKTRKWSLITYVSAEELEKLLILAKSYRGLVHYAYIQHEAEEEGKQTHIHLVVYFTNARRAESVKDMFKGNGNAMAEPLLDCERMVFGYFTHSIDKTKKQYTIAAVKSDNLDFWRKEEAENNAYNIVMDILDGTSTRELLRKYGREFAINAEKFATIARAITAEETEFEESNKLNWRN